MRTLIFFGIRAGAQNPERSSRVREELAEMLDDAINISLPFLYLPLCFSIFNITIFM